MKFNIAQIGANRLEKVLLCDKGQDPKQILSVIKSDIENVLNSYLDDFKIYIDFTQNEENSVFDINVVAKRIKDFGTLPY